MAFPCAYLLAFLVFYLLLLARHVSLPIISMASGGIGRARRYGRNSSCNALVLTKTLAILRISIKALHTKEQQS